jgi:GNAT superfamily N-acetyltransferase
MHMRRATNKDLSRIIDILQAGNSTDAFARYFNRDTELYPASYRIGCYRYIRGELLNPGALGFVVETEASDYTEGTAAKAPDVVGFAIWSRSGTSDVAKRWRREVNGSWLAGLNRTLAGLESKQLKIFHNVNRTYDHARFNAVLKQVLTEPWDKELLAEAWELQALFVDPPWQKRGLSRTLISWGKERATEEGVPVVVHGSAIGGIAYQSNGFKSVGGTSFGEFFDELEYGGLPMQNWVWVPEGKGLDDVPEKVRQRREVWLQEQRDKKAAGRK